MTLDFSWQPELEDWRSEVQEFLAANVTPAVRQEMKATGSAPPMRGPLQLQFRNTVAERGWLGVAIPQEYGGLGKGLLHEWVMLEEFAYQGAPPFDLTETTYAQVILNRGTEENKQTWLPRIVDYSVRMVLGQSEPAAGVDLSLIETTARREGDVYVINGQKIWNSMAHTATHQWLAARTSGRPGNRSGISIILVPMDQPGITIQQLTGWDDNRTNQTFFDDVIAPCANVIGRVDDGFSYAREVLETEGIKGPRIGSLLRAFEDLVAYCRSTTFNGRRIMDMAETRLALAEISAALEGLRLLSLRTTLDTMAGRSADVDRAEHKLRMHETMSMIADIGMQIVGVAGLHGRHANGAPVGGKLEEIYRQAPLRGFAGGALEIMRDIVAQRGLGLPGLQAAEPQG